MKTPDPLRRRVMMVGVARATSASLSNALARAGIEVVGYAGTADAALDRPLDAMMDVDLILVGPLPDDRRQAGRCAALRSHFGVPVAVLAVSAPAGLRLERAPAVDASLSLSVGVDAVSRQVEPTINRLAGRHPRRPPSPTRCRAAQAGRFVRRVLDATIGAAADHRRWRWMPSIG